MVPAVYNYGNQYRGDTLDSVQFTLIDKDTSLPIDLTGASLKIQFRKPFKGATQLTITDGSGITIVSPTTGRLIIDSFILDWDPGVYLYDIEITFANSTVKTYVRGSINVISDATI